MRLIDADELLEGLKKTDRYFMLKFDIENAPTVEINTNDIEYKAYSKGLDDGRAIAITHGEWIPCSERLPEEDGQYLVCWCGAYGVDVYIAEYIRNGKYWLHSEGCELRGITAWMPLPEPYKKEGEKNEQTTYVW